MDGEGEVARVVGEVKGTLELVTPSRSDNMRKVTDADGLFSVLNPPRIRFQLDAFDASFSCNLARLTQSVCAIQERQGDCL